MGREREGERDREREREIGRERGWERERRAAWLYRSNPEEGLDVGVNLCLQRVLGSLLRKRQCG